MTFNAKPNRDHLPNPGAQISSDIHNFQNPGIKVSVPEIRTGEPFELSVEGLTLLPLGEHIFTRIALVNEKGELKETIAETDAYWSRNLSMPAPAITSDFNMANLTISTSDLQPTDMLQLFIRRGEDGEWMPITSTLDGKSYAGISGHDWPTKKITFHIADGVKATLSQNSPQGNGIELKDGQQIVTLQRTTNVNLQSITPDADHRIKFSVNGRHRGNINSIYAVWEIAGYYNDTDNISLMFANKDVDNFDVNIEYVKIAEPLTLNLTKAGTLHTLISAEEAGIITNLTLTGKINAMDVWYVSDNFPILEYLDLSQTEIESCEVEEFPEYIALLNASKQQKANTMPEFGIVDMAALQDVQLPESMEYIGGWALSHNARFSRLELPAKLQGIYPFGDDKSMLWMGDRLEKVISKNPVPPVVDEEISIFRSSSDQALLNGALFVPAESVEAYKNANGWKAFKNIYPMGTCFIELDKAAIEISGYGNELISGKIIYQGNNPELNWSISNPEVCEMMVLNNHLISLFGRKNGTATITASAEIDGKTISAECVVTVTGFDPKRTIKMENHSEPIEAGKSHQMSAWILEDDVAKPLNENILWSSSDENIATIDKNGLLNAIAPGRTTIRATAAFDSELYTELIITVVRPAGINGIDNGIDAIRVEGNDIIAPDGSTIYDLAGRKVSGKGLEAGIYIVKTPSKAVKVVVR